MGFLRRLWILQPCIYHPLERSVHTFKWVIKFHPINGGVPCGAVFLPAADDDRVW
ncbi:hypothetical protein BGX38DRAFT_54089 [Terfezia claveryi]|nr:hypothetical protein BGX38DRAFT_54089 [Terfezia claveryi]